MIENSLENKDNEREQAKKEMIALAVELHESHERFSFPGIDPEVYLKAKSSEEEFPGYTTPIDELIKRFESEGIKVVLGKYDCIFILPSQSNDIENDSIFPRQLQISEAMDERIKKLILMNKDYFNRHVA